MPSDDNVARERPHGMWLSIALIVWHIGAAFVLGGVWIEWYLLPFPVVFFFVSVNILIYAGFLVTRLRSTIKRRGRPQAEILLDFEEREDNIASDTTQLVIYVIELVFLLGYTFFSPKDQLGTLYNYLGFVIPLEVTLIGLTISRMRARPPVADGLPVTLRRGLRRRNR